MYTIQGPFDLTTVIPYMSHDKNVPTLFQDEVWFAGWSDSHTLGPKITFSLRDSDQLEAFRAMTVRKGAQAGQRLAMVLVQIGDNEEPVDPVDAAPDAVTPPGGQLARLAGIWCNTPEFCDWLINAWPNDWDTVADGIVDASDSEIAAGVVRRLCLVKSRADLDHDSNAAVIFHERIRLPFMAQQ